MSATDGPLIHKFRQVYMPSDALLFAALHDSVPACKADAIVVLSGDGLTRLEHGINLLSMGWAPQLIVSGGLDNPPFSLTASDLRRAAIERGVRPLGILVESLGANTHEQAVNVLEIARLQGFASLLLVASSFHAWRAYLTFVARLNEIGEQEKICVIPASSRGPWFREVEGPNKTRRDLFADELSKIGAYQAKGHVATWAEGVEYLRYWDSK